MSGGAGPAKAAGTPQILVVEDDGDLLRMIVKMLEAVGTVSSALDGMAAWEMVESGLVPDLVVTDLMMPRMDGLTLVRRLKGHRPTSRVPVIMLTAKDAPRDVIAGINAGARNYLTKPFKHDELLEKVNKALGR